MQDAHDRMHLDDPGVIRRTVFVDSGSIKPIDFNITRAQQERLFLTGQEAANKFLDGWNFKEYLKAGRKDSPSSL